MARSVSRGPTRLLIGGLLLGACALPGLPDSPAQGQDDAPPAHMNPPEPPASVSDERFQLSFFGARLSDLLGFLDKVDPGWTLEPAVASVKVTLQGSVLVDVAELRWAIGQAARPHGVSATRRRLARTGPSTAAPDTQTLLLRSRAPSAERVAALADRVWRDRLQVGWRQDLLALTGPTDLVREAAVHLGERDHVTDRRVQAD